MFVQLHIAVLWPAYGLAPRNISHEPPPQPSPLYQNFTPHSTHPTRAFYMHCSASASISYPLSNAASGASDRKAGLAQPAVRWRISNPRDVVVQPLPICHPPQECASSLFMNALLKKSHSNPLLMPAVKLAQSWAADDVPRNLFSATHSYHLAVAQDSLVLSSCKAPSGQHIRGQ